MDLMSNLLKEHWQQDDINKTKGKSTSFLFNWVLFHGETKIFQTSP